MRYYYTTTFLDGLSTLWSKPIIQTKNKFKGSYETSATKTIWQESWASASNILQGGPYYRQYPGRQVVLPSGRYQYPIWREGQQDGVNIRANVLDGKSRIPPKVHDHPPQYHPRSGTVNRTPKVWNEKELGNQRRATSFWSEGLKKEKDKNANYKLVMKDLISHFFPPKALQRQKRYLRRGLYKPCKTKIQDFIYWIDDMVEYLEKFPPFGAGKTPPEDKILELVEF